jgi:RimJ/RimL family protein N-acetyltransferase
MDLCAEVVRVSDMTRVELATARLILRPVSPKDEGEVVACLNDLTVTGWLAVVPHPYTAADFRDFQSSYAVPGDTFSVHDADGLAGIVGVEDRTLGYWFAPSVQGRGYATEAARAALAEHFAADPAPIASGYFDGNARSANVLRKLGFVETGRRQKFCRALGHDRPHVDMHLTLQDFQAGLPVDARTARLTCRALQATDLAALHLVVSDYEVVKQLASYPWPADPAFTATRACPYAGRGFVWGLFRYGDLLGTVAVTGDELGYMLRRDAWGQGYATEACRLAIAHAFAAGRDNLTAGIWADNAASLGLLQKLGFRIIGHDRSLNKARGQVVDGHLLRLDRADWPQPA